MFKDVSGRPFLAILKKSFKFLVLDLFFYLLINVNIHKTFSNKKCVFTMILKTHRIHLFTQQENKDMCERETERERREHGN